MYLRIHFTHQTWKSRLSFSKKMENHVGEPFGILSMTTMHSWQRIKPPSLLPNHHPLLQGDVEGWRNTGWAGVTSTTEELLRYWFEEERDGANFHPCQRQAIETIILQKTSCINPKTNDRNNNGRDFS